MKTGQMCLYVIVGTVLLSPGLSVAEQPKNGTTDGSMKSQSQQQ